MTYGKTASVLKPPEELTLPDPRIEFEPYRPQSDQSLNSAAIHERLEAFARLHDGVPQMVKTQFEVARNLMLYTYFVFEFQTQAELQAYAALEFALRERFGRPTREIKRGKKSNTVPLMLRELLRKAMKEKLLQPERLPSWEWANQTRKLFAENYDQKITPLTPGVWIAGVIKAIADSRNHLAHGSPHLHLPNSFNRIELCADIINSLFQKTDEKPNPRAT